MGSLFERIRFPGAEKKRKAFRVEGTNDFPELKELESILERDQNVINDLFAEIQRKSGVSHLKTIPHIVRLDMSKRNIVGEMKPEVSDTVFLNRQYLLKQQQSLQDPAVAHIIPYVPYQLLQIYLHEAVHRTGDNQLKTKILGKPVPTASGLQNMRTRLGSVLNEAVTEHIANTLFDQYVNRSASLAHLSPKARKEILAFNALGSYQEERRQLFSYIGLAAKKLEVSEDVMWQALTRQYFTGEIPLDEFHDALMDIADSDIDPTDMGHDLTADWDLLGRAMVLVQSPLLNKSPASKPFPLNETLATQQQTAHGLRLD